jgi:hypothetical protein
MVRCRYLLRRRQEEGQVFGFVICLLDGKSA